MNFTPQSDEHNPKPQINEEYEIQNKFLKLLIMTIGPSQDAIESRNKIVTQVTSIIKITMQQLNLMEPSISQSGSFPLRTFLPEGDIDLTIIVPKEYDDNPQPYDVLKELKGRFESLINEPDSCVSQVCQVNLADVKVLKVNIKGINVDITFRQQGGSLSLQFLEYANLMFDSRADTQAMFFKFCIILCKAQINQECRLLGSNQGLLSTQSLEVMVLQILNRQHQELNGNLFKFFMKFIETQSNLDQKNMIITIFGLIKKEDIEKNLLALDKIDNMGPNIYNLLIHPYLVEQQKYYDTEREFAFKNMNILDPLNSRNNIGRSISLISKNRLNNCFQFTFEILSNCQPFYNLNQTQNEENKMRIIFKNTYRQLNHLKNKQYLIYQSPNSNYIDSVSTIGSLGERSFGSCNVQPQVLADSKLWNDKLTMKRLCVDYPKINSYHFSSEIKISSGSNTQFPNRQALCNEQSSLFASGTAGVHFRLISTDMNEILFQNFTEKCLVSPETLSVLQAHAEQNDKGGKMDKKCTPNAKFQFVSEANLNFNQMYNNQFKTTINYNPYDEDEDSPVEELNHRTSSYNPFIDNPFYKKVRKQYRYK